jgi:hypothetical protein
MSTKSGPVQISDQSAFYYKEDGVCIEVEPNGKQHARYYRDGSLLCRNWQIKNKLATYAPRAVSTSNFYFCKNTFLNLDKEPISLLVSIDECAEKNASNEFILVRNDTYRGECFKAGRILKNGKIIYVPLYHERGDEYNCPAENVTTVPIGLEK